MRIHDKSKLAAALAEHREWMGAGAPYGDPRRLDARGASLDGASLDRACLIGIKLAEGGSWVSIGAGWHGECGRTLTIIRNGAAPETPALCWCGCVRGVTVESLRQYFADGDEKYRVSRTRVLDAALSLLD